MGRTRLLPILVAVGWAVGTQGQGNLNAISKIDVENKGGTVSIAIRGSKPPNFTTFSMADPPRFVIDFSESAFQGLPEEMMVNNGVINVIKNLSYGSEATAIARVMIVFSQDVDSPDVHTEAETLVVKIAKAASAPAVAKSPEPAKPDAAAAAKAAADAEAKKLAEAKKVADEEAKKAAEAKKVADADAKKAAEADAKKAAADAKVAAEEKKKADAQAKADEAARKKEEAAAKKAAEAEAKAAARAEREAKAAEAKAAREAKAAEAKAARAEPQVEGRIAARETPRRVTEVGFKQMPSQSRVFVRTSEPARFNVSESGERTILVEFENTRAERRNDTRHLDTSFFPSAVTLVTPKISGGSYVLEIKLREKVPFQQRQEGGMLALDFEQPAGLRGEMPGSEGPAAPAPSSGGDEPPAEPVPEIAPEPVPEPEGAR
jgi:hypothetical protein